MVVQIPCRAFQHIPVDEYRATLQQMVKDARAAGAKRILLITPPPVDDAARVTYNQQVRAMHAQFHLYEMLYVQS